MQNQTRKTVKWQPMVNCTQWWVGVHTLCRHHPWGCWVCSYRIELSWFVWRTDAYSECPDKCCSLFLLQFKDCLGHALINSQHEVRLPEVSNYSNWRGMNLSSHGIVLNRRQWYFNSGWTKVRISHPLLCPSSPVFSFMHFVDWFGRLFYCWCHPSVKPTEHAGPSLHHWGGWIPQPAYLHTLHIFFGKG